MSISVISKVFAKEVAKTMRYGKDINAIKTGFETLDDILGGGLEPGKLYVLGSRPGMGKTALACNIVLNAINQGKNIVYATMDFTKEKLVERLIRTEAMIDCSQDGHSEDDWDRMIAAANKIGNSKTDAHSIVIDDTQGLSVEDILNDKSGMYKNADLIVLDYLQLMNYVRGFNPRQTIDRADEMDLICKDLKRYSMSKNVAILALSQMNRDCEIREDHRPIITDIKSIPVELYADAVMLLYIDDYYKQCDEKVKLAEVYVPQNSNGRRGCAELLWSPQYMKYTDTSK